MTISLQEIQAIIITSYRVCNQALYINAKKVYTYHWRILLRTTEKADPRKKTLIEQKIVNGEKKKHGAVEHLMHAYLNKNKKNRRQERNDTRM